MSLPARIMAPNYVPVARPEPPSKIAALAAARSTLNSILSDGSNNVLPFGEVVRAIKDTPGCSVLNRDDIRRVIGTFVATNYPDGQPPEYTD